MPDPRILGLCAAALLAVPSTARAAEDAETIVVTGRGLADTPALPAYGTVEIGRETIASSASGRIEDVLSSVAGFQQFRRSDSRSSNPSAQGVTLRALGGNASTRALVLLDGVPMEHPFFGYVPLSAIAPERLSAIRVTRGGGAGAFGAGAVAGTIELTSAGPDTLGLLDASGLVNDRGESELSATAAPRLGEGYALASVRWDRGQGFFTTPQDQRMPATGRARFDSWSAALRTVSPLSDTVELHFSGLVFDDQRRLRFAGAESSSSGQDASVRLVGRGNWQFDALAYVQARDFSNVVISSTSFRRTLDQRATPSTGLGGKLELRPPLGDNHLMRLGADVRITRGTMEEDAYSGLTGAVTERRRAGGRNSDLGLYLEHDWTIGPVVLTGGVRADRWSVRNGYYRAYAASGMLARDDRFADRSGWETSWRGGALWRLDDRFSLRAAGYTGLRLPTLNELYRPFVVFPVVTRANADLRPERLEGFEAGLDFEAGAGFGLSVTAFDNRLKGAIANVTIGPALRERQNVDAIRARGLELEARARLGALSFDGSLTWTDSEVLASGVSAALNGLRPSHVPKIAASATVGWRPAAGWLIAATLRHTGQEFEDDLETDVLPATTTLGAYAELPVSGRFSVVLRGENLTGERIVTRNQGGSIDLGVPRTVWAGIRVRIGR